MKKGLIISVVINILFILFGGYAIHKKGGKTYIKYKLGMRIEKTFSTKHNPYWDRRFSLFQVLPNGSDEIVFFGNSLTEFCEWSELFQNPNIKNRGISGDKLTGLLDRLDEVVESQPKKIFIEVGINDLKDFNTYEITSNYKLLVYKIKQQSPLTKIYIQSILPTNFFDTFPPDTIKSLNRKIESMAVENSLTYIDLHDLFLNENGNFNLSLSFDGIHPNGKGYSVWKNAIENYVND